VIAIVAVIAINFSLLFAIPFNIVKVAVSSNPTFSFFISLLLLYIPLSYVVALCVAILSAKDKSFPFHFAILFNIKKVAVSIHPTFSFFTSLLLSFIAFYRVVTLCDSDSCCSFTILKTIAKM
jgi:hypothetical protein